MAGAKTTREKEKNGLQTSHLLSCFLVLSIPLSHSVDGCGASSEARVRLPLVMDA